jgi:pimeloyl-ACP methyl ester carboxylesterase
LSSIRRFLPVSCAALLVALVLATLAAPAARADESGIAAQKPGPKPQLILLHGGSFLFEDPYFEPLTRPRAVAAGFVPHYVTYPLGDLPAAVTAVRLEARRLREAVGIERVYAYGASAGGTLAAILDGEGDVAAAVAKAPVSDLATWEWPLGQYGPNYYETIMVSPAARFRFSPLRRPERNPLLVVQGRIDNVVPPAMSEAFAAKFPHVHLWLVPGGHTTERVRPYLISRAMRWLAQIADRHTRLEEDREPERLP